MWETEVQRVEGWTCPRPHSLLGRKSQPGGGLEVKDLIWKSRFNPGSQPRWKSRFDSGSGARFDKISKTCCYFPPTPPTFCWFRPPGFKGTSPFRGGWDPYLLPRGDGKRNRTLPGAGFSHCSGDLESLYFLCLLPCGEAPILKAVLSVSAPLCPGPRASAPSSPPQAHHGGLHSWSYNPNQKTSLDPLIWNLLWL